METAQDIFGSGFNSEKFENYIGECKNTKENRVESLIDEVKKFHAFNVRDLMIIRAAKEGQLAMSNLQGVYVSMALTLIILILEGANNSIIFRGTLIIGSIALFCFIWYLSKKEKKAEIHFCYSYLEQLYEEELNKKQNNESSQTE